MVAWGVLLAAIKHVAPDRLMLASTWCDGEVCITWKIHSTAVR